MSGKSDMESKASTVEYYLDGYEYEEGEAWDYVVTTHDFHHPPGRGVKSLLFSSGGITDSSYNIYGGHAVRVGEAVVERVLQMITEAYAKLGGISGEPISSRRKFQVGDCLMKKGALMRIVTLVPRKCEVEQLTVEEKSLGVPDNAERYPLQKLRTECRLITAEDYDRVRTVIEHVVEESHVYLKGQYEHHRRMQDVLEAMDEHQRGEPEYYLGAMYGNQMSHELHRDGMMLLCHYANHPQGMGYACFELRDREVKIGSNLPAGYNDTFVKVDKEVYQHARQILRSAKEKIEGIKGTEMIVGKEDLRVGHCVRGNHGRFFRIDEIKHEEGNRSFTIRTMKGSFRGSSSTGDCDSGTLAKESSDCIYDNLSARGTLITEEQYNEAQTVIEDAIGELWTCFLNEYKDYRGEEEYYLGRLYYRSNPHDEEIWELVHHYTNYPQGTGTGCFMARERWVGERLYNGDTTFDDTFVKVDKEVFHRVMMMQRSTMKQVRRINGTEVIPDEENPPVYAGLCFRDGGTFFRVVRVCARWLRVKSVMATDVYESYGRYLSINATEPNEFRCELSRPAGCRVITREQYDEARILIEEGRLETIKYLRAAYARGKARCERSSV